MALELILLVAVAVVVFSYVLFVRIRMREKSDAFNRNEKNDDRKQKHSHGGAAAATDSNDGGTTAASGVTKPGRKTAAASAATTIKKQRTAEANYQHPWLYTTLKGHTGQVFDMDFSRNGKYLATCGEDSPSAQSSSSSNHLINGNINENDEQNASTRSLSPASSSSSTSAFGGSVSDGKLTSDAGAGCTGSGGGGGGDGTSSSGGGSGSSSSSGGSTRGEDSPNAQGSSKKQRKYTKKKPPYKKANTNGTASGHKSAASNLRAAMSSIVHGGDEAGNELQDVHITQSKYFYSSTTGPASGTPPASHALQPKMATTEHGGATINSGNAGAAAGAASYAAPIKSDKNTRYQGRLDSSSRGVAQHRGYTDKKYHQDNIGSHSSASSPSVTLAAAAAAAAAAVATNNILSPLRQYVKLNLSENELVKYLRKYVLDKDVMKQLGFPVEYGLDMDKAIIYKFPHDFFRPAQLYTASPSDASTNSSNSSSSSTGGNEKRGHDRSATSADKSDDNDSGQGSGTSSPTNVDDNDALLMYRLSSKSASLKSPLNDMQLQPSVERECCRCGKGFFITRDGEYLTQEHCIYHWGRMTRIFNGLEFRKVFSCCNGEPDVKGCTINKLHVWTGLLSGFNGPFDGFVKTQPSPRKLKKFEKLLLNKFFYQSLSSDCLDLLQDDLLDDEESDGVYALDCEMSYTGRGLELTKVTVVSVDGNLVYERLVRPDIEIVDYNTRYSGVTEAHFADPNNFVTLQQVQKDLLKFIYDDTILIGHSIENDLKVLKIIHKTVIDTSITFPHMNGFPFRQSLKSLTKTILKRDIQMQTSGGVMQQQRHHHHHINNADLVCSTDSTANGSNADSSSSSNVCCTDSNSSSFSSSSSSSSNSSHKHNVGTSSSSSSISSSSSSFGHCSLEDSRASLELMLWRVRQDKAVYDNMRFNNNCYRMQNN